MTCALTHPHSICHVVEGFIHIKCSYVAVVHDCDYMHKGVKVSALSYSISYNAEI